MARLLFDLKVIAFGFLLDPFGSILNDFKSHPTNRPNTAGKPTGSPRAKPKLPFRQGSSGELEVLTNTARPIISDIDN